MMRNSSISSNVPTKKTFSPSERKGIFLCRTLNPVTTIPNSQ